MLSFILILFIFSFSFCLKLDLIDDYFIYAYIGDSQTEFKLLVDPTYPYTFILKTYKSSTKKTPNLNPLLFTNNYGNYSGKWTIDIFHFKKENITIEIKFLDIYYKKSNLLNADGVLGLGGYFNSDSNIFYYLNKLPNNCSNNIIIYDKRNKKISICEDKSTKRQKLSIALNYDSKEEQGLVNISKINFISNNNELKIKNEAFIGIIPILMPTNEVNQWIIENYLKNYPEEIKLINSNYYKQEIIENSPIKIIFNNSEYLYENNDKKNISYIKSFLNLNEFIKNINEKKNKWYLGLDNKNIEIVEFDYDKREINILLRSYKYLIIRIILFIIVLGFFIFAVLKVFLKKRDKNPKNENEQELMDI